MGKIIGDFKDYEKAVDAGEMSIEEYQKIFENARVHGMDDSVYPFAVGGSDASIILGASKFSTPVKLYREKMGIYKEIRSDSSELILYKGHLFEGPFRELFTKVTKIQTYPYYKQTVHEEYPHCVANIDGLAIVDGELWIYEGKTSQSFKTQNLFKAGKVPPEYYIQVQFYMAVIDELDEEVLSEVDPALPYLLSSFEVKGAIVNCGWGISEKEMYQVKIKRDRDVGEDILDLCESFAVDAMNGKAPSNENVQSVALLKADEFANYGAIDKTIPPKKLPAGFLPAIKAALEIEEQEKEVKKLLQERDIEIEKVKAKYKEADKVLKELEEQRNEYLYPLIDEIKSGTSGYIEDGDRKYIVNYDGITKPSLDRTVKTYWKEKYPECYEDIMNYKLTNKREFKITKE